MGQCLWCCYHDTGHFESSPGSSDECSIDRVWIEASSTVIIRVGKYHDIFENIKIWKISKIL